MSNDKPKTGRPTILNEELIKVAREYLDDCNGVGIHTLLPTVEGLALALHISRETVYDWSAKAKVTEENPEPNELNILFSDIVAELKAAQAQKLLQNSLLGRYNATIAKLILSGKHGYVEKSEQDIKSGGESLAPLLVKFVGEDKTKA